MNETHAIAYPKYKYHQMYFYPSALGVSAPRLAKICSIDIGAGEASDSLTLGHGCLHIGSQAIQ